MDKATALEHVALRLSRPAALERGVHAASTCELDKATALEPAALRLIFVLKPPVLWRKLRREMMLRVNDAISRSLCRRVQVILAALALLALCGCGSVTARVKGGSDPYCGFAYDLEKVATAGEWCDWSAEGRVGDVPVAGPRGVLWIIDAPLSFVGDTILLPLDLLRPAPADSAP
jgi:uncharacterized protein YceK